MTRDIRDAWHREHISARKRTLKRMRRVIRVVRLLKPVPFLRRRVLRHFRKRLGGIYTRP